MTRSPMIKRSPSRASLKMAMEENREEDVDSSRRRVWESPYVRREDGEFEPIQAKDKSPAISEKTVGVRTFGESVQKGHMKSPGDIVGIGKMEHEVAKLRSELRSKSAVQLKEAVARQSKLLENKALVSRLPDKGEKCRLSLTVMKQLLSERRKEEDLEVGMEKMKISTERMEWKNRLLDSDDDSDPEKDPEDPLAVLAQGLVPHTSTRAKSIPTNEIPTRDEDRTENGNSNVLGARQAEVEKFATAQASRVDLVLMPHNRFTPHSSVKQTALDPELRHRLGAGGTSSKPEGSPSPKPGTPNMPLPPTYSNTTCLLTLGDSLRLQQEQEKRVREAQVVSAQSRLTASRGLVVDGAAAIDAGRFTEYRTAGELSEDEDEVEDEDEGRGVVGVVGNPVEEEE